MSFAIFYSFSKLMAAVVVNSFDTHSTEGIRSQILALLEI